MWTSPLRVGLKDYGNVMSPLLGTSGSTSLNASVTRLDSGFTQKRGAYTTKKMPQSVPFAAYASVSRGEDFPTLMTARVCGGDARDQCDAKQRELAQAKKRSEQDAAGAPSLKAAKEQTSELRQQMTSAKTRAVEALRKPPVDQYAAAASLYFLLTKKYVYDLPKELSKQLTMILQDDVVPLTQRRTDLPTTLVAVIHQALAREPIQRFANVAEFRQALLPLVRAT